MPLCIQKLIEVKGSRDEAFDAFFWNLALEAMERSKRVDSTKKRYDISRAANTVALPPAETAPHSGCPWRRRL